MGEAGEGCVWFQDLDQATFSVTNILEWTYLERSTRVRVARKHMEWTHFPDFLWLHIARKALQSIRKHQEQSGFDPLNCVTRQNQSSGASNILGQSL